MVSVLLDRLINRPRQNKPAVVVEDDLEFGEDQDTPNPAIVRLEESFAFKTRVKGEWDYEANAPVVPPRPVFDRSRVSVLETYEDEKLRSYHELSKQLRVVNQDLQVAVFESYLRREEFTVFHLPTVVEYMDARSKADGARWGWEWKALRDDDVFPGWFGTSASRGETAWDEDNGRERAASDHYSSPNPGFKRLGGSTGTYGKSIPGHALEKIAKIEAEFEYPVKFLVSDYAPAPAFREDPFLMAVIPNPRLGAGVGRYVIDVWDEPGFGIDKMVRSGL